MERENMRRILLPLLLACVLSTQAAYKGTVKETMNSGGYSYVLLETAEGDLWFAGPETTIKQGATLELPESMPMNNFNARSLDRTFETIYFVNSLDATPAATAPASDPHANVPGFKSATQTNPMKPEAGSLAKADYTVSELFFQPKLLTGKVVSVRGKVVKYNGGILGSNWIHLMDGTGEAGKDDIVLTTTQECEVGDVILAKGTLGVDKDLGMGYFFPVIIENTEITVEQTRGN